MRTLVAELRAMQRVAASLFPSEPLKPMLPQGPFRRGWDMISILLVAYIVLTPSPLSPLSTCIRTTAGLNSPRS